MKQPTAMSRKPINRCDRGRSTAFELSTKPGGQSSNSLTYSDLAVLAQRPRDRAARPGGSGPAAAPISADPATWRDPRRTDLRPESSSSGPRPAASRPSSTASSATAARTGCASTGAAPAGNGAATHTNGSGPSRSRSTRPPAITEERWLTLSPTGVAILRQIMVPLHFENCSPTEIGKRLGIKPFAVRLLVELLATELSTNDAEIPSESSSALEPEFEAPS
jgi:hypothetical protein